MRFHLDWDQVRRVPCSGQKSKGFCMRIHPSLDTILPDAGASSVSSFVCYVSIGRSRYDRLAVCLETAMKATVMSGQAAFE